MNNNICEKEEISVEISPSYVDQLKGVRGMAAIDSSDRAVVHPPHYGGDVPYEAIKVIEAWEEMNPNLGFSLLTAVKYLARAGLKDDILQDLKKVVFYVQREIVRIQKFRQDSK